MTVYDKGIHHRRSIRLKDYDYSKAGAYFVTICTRDKGFLFGDIVDGNMILNESGDVVNDTWTWLSNRYPYVDIDTWIVMPNHTHAVIVIEDCRGASGRAPSSGGSRAAPTNPKKVKSLGSLIGVFKTVSAKLINEIMDGKKESVWQRNYYEHVIRDEDRLLKIREYIINNPLQWRLDRENPDRVGENKLDRLLYKKSG